MGTPKIADNPNPDSAYALQETIADIAYQAGVMHFYSGDSRADVRLFITWAEEFEKLRAEDADGNPVYNGQDYMTAIEEFTTAKLNDTPHPPQP
jgi:hypothetical protein